MLLSFAYTRFVRPLFAQFSLTQSGAHVVTTSPAGNMYRVRHGRTKCAHRVPLGPSPDCIPLSRCLFGHSMAGPLFGAHFGGIGCRRSGMAYANRLSLAAPGPGPLAGGRWHKPSPPPGLPPGPGLPWAHVRRPRAPPCGGSLGRALWAPGGLAGLGPCLGLGGLAWAPGRPPLPGSLTGSQWGRPCRAAWRLIMALTIGRAPAQFGRAPLGGRAPLRAREASALGGPPLALNHGQQHGRAGCLGLGLSI